MAGGGPGPAFYDVALPHMRQTLMLDFRDEWRLHGASGAFRIARVHARSLHSKYVADIRSRDLPRLTWMPTSDASLASLPLGMDLYRADMLLRGFLRYVLQWPNQVVLAGSAGTAMLLNKLGVPRDWRPHDIDIFVTAERRVHHVEDAYVAGVLKPLGCKHWEQATQLFKHDNEDHPREVAAPEVFVRELRGAAAEAFEELRELIEEGPADGRNASYEVLQTVNLLPQLPENGLRAVLSTFVRPLNIVLIRAPVSPGKAMDLASCVRGGFDLVPCAVTVTMEEDLRFRCTCDVRTLAAARLSLLFFNAEHFRRRSRDDVPKLIERVRKYAGRGFKFTRLTSAVLSSLEPNDSAAGAALMHF